MWGINTFDNNDALEWLKKLKISNNFNEVANLVNQYQTQEAIDDLILKQCTELLAAVEVIASAKTDDFKTFPADQVDWLANSEYSYDDKVFAAAKKTAELIKKDSEIRELYLESPLLKSWEEYMNELINKL